MSGMGGHTTVRNSADGGFTLVELLVVLTLLALMASLAFTSVRSSNDETGVRSSALQVANLMRMARGAAIRDNVEQTLTIDLGARRFWVDGLTNAHEFPKDIGVELAAQGMAQGMAQGAPQVWGRQVRIRFFIDGGATGCVVALATARRTARIELDGFTGHVKVRWE